MNDLEKHSDDVLASMREAVIEALETKRRMGHYAVIVEDGKHRRVPAEELGELIAAAKAK